MERQFRLTIQTAAPVASLVEALLGVGDTVTVTAADTYWDTGLGVGTQPADRVEIILSPEAVFLALNVLEGWHSTEGEPTLTFEMQEVFARRLG